MRRSSVFSALVLTGLVLAWGTGCESTPPPAGADELRMPAEWEPHEAMWLAWPTYDSMVGRPKEPLYQEIIKALAPHVKVNLVVQSQAEAERVQGVLAAERIPSGHVTFRVIPSAIDIWMRDTGPTFVKDGAGRARAVDFRFNSWGYEGHTSLYPWDSDVLDRDAANLLGVPVVESQMISEGGALEVNGRGTLIITEAVAFHRNPHMSRSEIEAEYKRTLGIKKVIWLKEGVPEDDLAFWRKRGVPNNVFTALAVGGHTDEFVRFVDEDTLLLAEVTEEEAAEDALSAVARQRLEAAYATLRSATDQDGKPFEIIRVPATTSIYETMGREDETYRYIASLTFEDGTVIPEGSRITVVSATSYLNFLITNGIVLTPVYWKQGRPASMAAKDNRMKQILQKAFPDREIVGINPEAINVGGGGIHCITQQQPVGVMASTGQSVDGTGASLAGLTSGTTFPKK